MPIHFKSKCQSGSGAKRKDRIIRTVKPIYGFDSEGKSYLFKPTHEFMGLYAISVNEITNEDKTVVYSKVGLSTNLVQCQSQYHLCFPDGTWLLSLMFLTQQALNQGLPWSRKFLRLIEKRFFEILKSYRYKPMYESRLREHEWVHTSITKIRNAFLKIQKEHSEYLFVLFPSEWEDKKQKPIDGLKALGMK